MRTSIPRRSRPITLQARIAPREIASLQLAKLGYCPNGFSGADTIFTTDSDRIRVAFVLDCLAP